MTAGQLQRRDRSRLALAAQELPAGLGDPAPEKHGHRSLPSGRPQGSLQDPAKRPRQAQRGGFSLQGGQERPRSPERRGHRVSAQVGEGHGAAPGSSGHETLRPVKPPPGAQAAGGKRGMADQEGLLAIEEGPHGLQGSLQPAGVDGPLPAQLGGSLGAGDRQVEPVARQQDLKRRSRRLEPPPRVAGEPQLGEDQLGGGKYSGGRDERRSPGKPPPALLVAGATAIRVHVQHPEAAPGEQGPGRHAAELRAQDADVVGPLHRRRARRALGVARHGAQRSPDGLETPSSMGAAAFWSVTWRPATSSRPSANHCTARG